VPRLGLASFLAPSPQPSPRGRGSPCGAVLWSPLPLGEGQGEGHSCYDPCLLLTFETASEKRPDSGRFTNRPYGWCGEIVCFEKVSLCLLGTPTRVRRGVDLS